MAREEGLDCWTWMRGSPEKPSSDFVDVELQEGCWTRTAQRRLRREINRKPRAGSHQPHPAKSDIHMKFLSNAKQCFSFGLCSLGQYLGVAPEGR